MATVKVEMTLNVDDHHTEPADGKVSEQVLETLSDIIYDVDGLDCEYIYCLELDE